MVHDLSDRGGGGGGEECPCVCSSDGWLVGLVGLSSVCGMRLTLVMGIKKFQNNNTNKKIVPMMLLSKFTTTNAPCM